MFKAIVLFIIGLVCLIFGGDWFVDGATGIARKFHLPEILIGATVVSIGTTLPEVMVSTTSALKGIGSIAYGNAIGSIICNTALISAITITAMPGLVDRKSMKTPVIFFFVTFALYAFAAYILGTFTRPFGLLMLVIFLAYMFVTIRQMKNNPAPEKAEKEEHEEDMSMGKAILLLVVGAELGVPETVIALTFVALGTSLPELVTAITSLMKGHGALSLGNIIGANLFNLVLVCGVSITLAPFDLPNAATFLGRNASLTLELPVACLVMLIMTAPALVKGKLMRWQGIALLAIYAAFCIIQFTM